jgi:hypothetical protein
MNFESEIIREAGINVSGLERPTALATIILVIQFYWWEDEITIARILKSVHFTWTTVHVLQAKIFAR